MNIKMLLLGMTAGTLALSACAKAPVQTPSAAPEALESLGNIQQFDLKDPNGGRVLLDLGNDAPSSARSVQALKEDVAKYTVCIAPAADPATALLEIDVNVNPTNSSRSKVAFLGLRPGDYVITVRAIDRAGNNVTLGGSCTQDVTVLAARMHLAAITVQLTETYLNTPGGGATRFLDAESGEVVEHEAVAEASGNTSDEPGYFGWGNLTAFISGSTQYDDESWCELKPAGFQISNQRTYTAFSTDGSNNVTHIPGARIIHHNLNPLVQYINPGYALRILEVRFGDRAMFLAFNDEDTSNPRMSLRGISKLYDVASGPSEYRWIDIEKQQNAKFFGTSTPATGIDTKRYYFLYEQADGDGYAPICTLDIDKYDGGGIVNLTMPDPDDDSKILHIQALNLQP